MKHLIIILVLVVVSVTTTFSQSSDKSYVSRNRESLRGITNVKLVVNYVLPGTESIIAKSSVFSLAEKKIASSGLKVLNEPYPPKSDLIPTIHVIYSIQLSDDEESLLYNIGIELSQKAILLRNNEIETSSITWIKSFYGIDTVSNINRINKEMLNYLDLFIEDWRDVNKLAIKNKK